MTIRSRYRNTSQTDTSIALVCNEIDEIYKDKKPVKIGYEYHCPVCSKTYKTKDGIDSHLEKKDCFKAADVFKNTQREKKAYELFCSIKELEGKDKRVPLHTFRKSSHYKSIIKFLIICSMYDIQSPDMFYAWLTQVKGYKLINAALKYGSTDIAIRDFREWLIQNNHLIESESFFERRAEDIEQDPFFLKRSLEKAHISLPWLLEKDNLTLEDFFYVYGVPLSYQYDIMAIKELIDKGK